MWEKELGAGRGPTEDRWEKQVGVSGKLRLRCLVDIQAERWGRRLAIYASLGRS